MNLNIDTIYKQPIKDALIFHKHYRLPINKNRGSTKLTESFVHTRLQTLENVIHLLQFISRTISFFRESVHTYILYFVQTCLKQLMHVTGYQILLPTGTSVSQNKQL